MDVAQRDAGVETGGHDERGSEHVWVDPIEPALASPAWKALRDDGHTIFDYRMMWGAEVRAHVVIA